MFNGATKNVEQATLYKQMLAAHQNESFIAVLIVLAITGLDNQASQNLVRCLGFQAKAALRNKLKELLTEELAQPELREVIGQQSAAEVIVKLESSIVRYFAGPAGMRIEDVLKPFYTRAAVEHVMQ